MMQPGRKYSSGSKYRYGFNGKENDNEVKGEGNQQDYGMRIYDTRLGKFLSVDPLNKEYPWNSTYAFAENDVISCIDLEGLEKYRMVGRSFAPRGSFEGTHFEAKADDRTKFEAADYKKVSARIHIQVTMDMSKWTQSNQISSQPTIGLDGSVWPITQEKINMEGFGFPQKNNLRITGNYTAVNGMNFGPGIDIQYDVNLVRNQKSNILTIRVNVTGNIFPAQETVLFDEKGVGLFLGTSTAVGNPLTGVWGTGEENVLYNQTISVKTDSKGNFKGVYIPDSKNGRKLISIDEYNKRFTDKKVWDKQDNREDYKEKKQEQQKEKKTSTGEGGLKVEI